ncbi:SAG family member [Eimeria mitis]|uniref:SAG family member n=1 Tax=Eimeria mitis TaxID=44415 RepID=U6KHD3_9EIME|nr:SAG family member [Eimeria mitis]CDJ36211.1 SAG family member [Eimeria mitis]
MAALKLFSLASASVLVMANAVHQTAKESPLTTKAVTATYTVNLGNTGECLAEINAAREAAGLAHFQVAKEEQHQWPKTDIEEPESSQASPWKPVCDALIAEDTEQQGGELEENGFESGTYAFMALESATPDCAAAVKHWKDAVSNFTTIPPPKNKEPELYAKQQNVSLIALYNPSENAAADCRVVTCTRPGASDNSQSNFRSTAEEKKGYALLCMTTPEALEDDEAPFTDEQWNKIKASITGSASAVAPSLLAVVVAAVGLLAL